MGRKLMRIFAYVLFTFALLLLLLLLLAHWTGSSDTPAPLYVIVGFMVVTACVFYSRGTPYNAKFTTKKCPECDATMPLEAKVCPECETKQKKGDVTCGSGVTSTKDARSYFAEQRRQAKGVGSTEYIWRTSKDGDVCERCRGMDGKRVQWDKEPLGGHAGGGARCRCYPEAVIK